MLEDKDKMTKEKISEMSLDELEHSISCETLYDTHRKLMKARIKSIKRNEASVSQYNKVIELVETHGHSIKRASEIVGVHNSRVYAYLDKIDYWVETKPNQVLKSKDDVFETVKPRLYFVPWNNIKEINPEWFDELSM